MATQENINETFLEISEMNTSKIVAMEATLEGVAIYVPENDKLYQVAFDKELDFDIADSVIHSFETIIGGELKETLKSLLENNIISELFHITDKLIDLGVVQHLIDENRTRTEEKKEGMFTESLEYFRNMVKLFELEMKILSVKQVKMLERIEGPLIKTLAQMETTGIGVDVKYLEEMGDDLESQIIKLGGKLTTSFGDAALNLNSPKQLAHIFFDVMKIPVKEKWKTPSGAVSVGAAVLQEIAKEYPQAGELLEYREMVKMKGTYVDSLKNKVKNGRVYAQFHQTGTVTGRLSSSNPNLQNQPTSLKYDIRQAFVAKEGYSFVDADYSQIELRILAHFSGDEAFIKAYNEGRDIHQETADKLGITRAQAKGINFGIVYGMSGFSLADHLGVSNDEANSFIKKYFEAFPKVKQFIENTKKELSSSLYGETLWGRRRHFPEYNTASFVDKSRIGRQVVNARIQGTAADIMKLSLIRLSVALRPYDARLLVTVHDEVIVEANDNQLEEVKQVVKTTMENIKISVPLSVEVKISKKWQK